MPQPYSKSHVGMHITDTPDGYGKDLSSREQLHQLQPEFEVEKKELVKSPYYQK